MASAKASFRAAVNAHREALGMLNALRMRLERLEHDSQHGAESVREQLALAAQLDSSAAAAAPEWLGAPWDVIARERFAVGTQGVPGDQLLVRIADALPVPDAGFAVVIPLIGAGHLAIDTDARDPAVLGLLRSLLTRLLAAFQPGAIRVLAVDGGALGAPFAPFRALVQAEVMSNPVTDVEGFRSVLDVAERQVRQVQDGTELDPDVLLVVAAALPPGCGRGEYGRLAALAHAGPAARVHLVLAGYPPERDNAWERRAALERTTFIGRHPTARNAFRLSDPPGESFSDDGRGLNVPIVLDGEPPADLLRELGRLISTRADLDRSLHFDDLVPAQLWTESSLDGLSTVIGRIGRAPASIALDDATPHWLVGGRTGSGKTVFLLDVLYGLAARYSPDELAFYLLDFKEGVSFTEFVPTDRDPTWIPHARTVGVESAREYGLAVLRELVKEMGRRATAMKQAGVTNLAQLRKDQRDIAVPRIVTVIDEFHVLFQGNDDTAERAAALLEEIARKGRSYGIHLVLASQSISGIEALFGRSRSLFGQFGLRVALSGSGGILDAANSAADALPIGHVVLNTMAGVKAGNQVAQFPAADQQSLALLRHRLWEKRRPGATAPAAFIGYAEYTVEQDPTYLRMVPGVKRPRALVGRAVDIGLPAIGLSLERVPGRHLAVVGTSAVGASILHASCLSLAQQYEAGQATFLLAGLVEVADDVVDETRAAVEQAGQVCEVLDVPGYRDAIVRLSQQQDFGSGPVFLAVFGADAAASTLRQRFPDSRRSPLDDFQTLLRDGPARDTHVLGWWRGLRRLTEDLGTGGRDDIAGFVALNIRGSEFSAYIGQYGTEWAPRENRALFIDRHDDSAQVIVPFVRPGRHAN